LINHPDRLKRLQSVLELGETIEGMSVLKRAEQAKKKKKNEDAIFQKYDAAMAKMKGEEGNY
jgi:hypothetical protein